MDFPSCDGAWTRHSVRRGLSVAPCGFNNRPPRAERRIKRAICRDSFCWTPHRAGLYCRGLIGGEANGVATVEKRGIRFGRIFLWLLLIVIALTAAWTAFTLSWAYSEGDRAGVLQKFSSKGWICKTYEGELALYVVGGVAPQIWYFSTRDEDVAKQLSAAVGKNIQLHYTEHRGVPTSCFAETPYFAQSFRVVGDANTGSVR
jgi:hypothetical protein